MDENFRVQEFVAHSTAVNCAAIGPKSNQVFATGGEDTKVNVWRVGSVSNIWTLGHNKSPIESLCFDSDEVNVISGAFNGSLKVYDLNEGKLARNLGSHQVGVTSIQYHPFGEFLVSGSSDCVMKFWDVRAKSCVESYTGHKKEITCVRFSPDGKWVASSSKDGQLIFYDLIASKHINTIKLPQYYITGFEFNPTEFSLAAATTARNVRLWDLETMKPIFTTPAESNNLVKAITFSNLGTQLYTTAKANLKCWDIESMIADGNSNRAMKSVDVGWENIVDMRITNNDSMVAVSYLSNFVSVWELELSHFFPNGVDDTGNDGNEEESKPSQPVATRARGDSLDVAPSKPSNANMNTPSAKHEKPTTENKRVPTAEPAPTPSNNGIEGLYIAGSKFRNANTTHPTAPATANAAPSTQQPGSKETGQQAYYVKEVKLSHIREQKDPASDEKSAPQQQPLSARGVGGVRTGGMAVRAAGAAGNHTPVAEVSEYKASVYNTPTQQAQQGGLEDEIVDEEDDYVYDEREFRAPLQPSNKAAHHQQVSQQARRGGGGNAGARGRMNRYGDEIEEEEVTPTEEEDEVMEEEDAFATPPNEEIEDELTPLPSHPSQVSRGGPGAGAGRGAAGGGRRIEEVEDDDDEEELVPEEPVPAPMSPQDMARSMGDSFWKRFQQQGQPAQPSGVVLGADQYDLPPSNFAKAGGNNLYSQPTPTPAVVASNGSNKNARSSPQPSNPGPVAVAGGGIVRTNSTSSSNKRDSYNGNVMESKDDASSFAVVGQKPLARPTSQSGLTPVNGGGPSSGAVGGGAGVNRTPNSGGGGNISIAVPPLRSQTAAPSSSANANNAANNPANEMNTCLTILDNLLTSTTVFQNTLTSRLTTLKTLRTYWTQGHIPLLLDHMQVLLSTIQSYPTSASSSTLFYTLCEFLYAISFIKVNISLEACTKVLPWLSTLLQYHYDNYILSVGNASQSSRPSTAGGSVTPRSANTVNPFSPEVILAQVWLVIQGIFKHFIQLLTGFGELIRNTRSIGYLNSHGGVDVNREERYGKCTVCYTSFQDALTYSDKYMTMLKLHGSSRAGGGGGGGVVTSRGQGAGYLEEEELLIEYQTLYKRYF